MQRTVPTVQGQAPAAVEQFLQQNSLREDVSPCVNPLIAVLLNRLR